MISGWFCVLFSLDVGLIGFLRVVFSFGFLLGLGGLVWWLGLLGCLLGMVVYCSGFDYGCGASAMGACFWVLRVCSLLAICEFLRCFAL